VLGGVYGAEVPVARMQCDFRNPGVGTTDQTEESLSAKQSDHKDGEFRTMQRARYFKSKLESYSQNSKHWFRYFASFEHAQHFIKLSEGL